MFKFTRQNNKKTFFRNLSISFFVILSFLIFSRANAANLLFGPSIGTYAVDDTFVVSVLVNTETTAINSIETFINFPTDLLDVVFVSKASSIFSLWIQEPTYSNVAGNISFTGGLPTPGYIGSNGRVMDVTFKAKKEGIAKVTFSSSAVRANDGLGTDVLQTSGQGEYTIGPKKVIPIIPKITPVITSTTHPDSSIWYSNNNPTFSWTYNGSYDSERITYDETPVNTPTTLYNTKLSGKDFTNVSNGIHYLHLQVHDKNGWSNTANFKFQVDTEAPTDFTIVETNPEDLKKQQVNFTWNATDALSGLNRFEVKVDNNNPITLTDINNQTFTTNKLDPGTHVIIIKAFDNAGNYITSTLVFSTYPLTPFSTTTEEVATNIKKDLGNLLTSASNAVKKLGDAINSPVGSVVTKTITTTGLITSSALSVLAVSVPASFSDLWLILARLLGLLFGVIGLRKRERPWGTVYDSITKRPLDPAYVSLIDLETGKEIASAITDLDGRYGFLVVPGRYGIEAKKTNYVFPSTKMKGKAFDEVYNDLYFGGEILITKQGEVITKNIPMDSLSFDWNEFAKNKMNINTFIKDTDILKARISAAIFIVGAIVSALALVFAPMPYNFIIAGLYIVSYLLNYVVFKKQKPGILTERHGSIPLSYAIIKIYREGEETPLTKKIADKLGKYYALVPNGRYHLIVDKKNDDETYTEVLHTADIDIKDGIINFDIKI